jgi:hypothetical protein
LFAAACASSKYVSSVGFFIGLAAAIIVTAVIM